MKTCESDGQHFQSPNWTVCTLNRRIRRSALGQLATGEQTTGEQATGELATGKRQAKQPLFGVHATPRNLSERLYDSESLQIATSFSMVANNTYEPLL